MRLWRFSLRMANGLLTIAMLKLAGKVGHFFAGNQATNAKPSMAAIELVNVLGIGGFHGV